MRWPWQKRESEWPPLREYEWRPNTGEPFGRSRSLNACLFQIESYRRDAVTPGVDGVIPKNPCYIHVVATGERVIVATFPDGARQLYESPDLPRFR